MHSYIYIYIYRHTDTHPHTRIELECFTNKWRYYWPTEQEMATRVNLTETPNSFPTSEWTSFHYWAASIQTRVSAISVCFFWHCWLILPFGRLVVKDAKEFIWRANPVTLSSVCETTSVLPKARGIDTVGAYHGCREQSEMVLIHQRTAQPTCFVQNPCCTWLCMTRSVEDDTTKFIAQLVFTLEQGLTASSLL